MTLTWVTVGRQSNKGMTMSDMSKTEYEKIRQILLLDTKTRVNELTKALQLSNSDSGVVKQLSKFDPVLAELINEFNATAIEKSNKIILHMARSIDN